MSVRFEAQEGRALRVARSTFAAIGAAEAIDGPAPEAIPFGRIYAYATDPEKHDPELEAALDAVPRLRADLRRLLEKACASHMPRLAAASSGEIQAREGTGYRISLKPSQAEPSQIYVIVELTDDRPAYALYFCDSGGNFRKVTLPPARDGVVQMLTERESDLVRWLSDHETEIFLG